MPWRVLLFFSLAANLALALGWWAAGRRVTNLVSTVETNVPTLIIKTNVEIRRQFFSWSQIESTDYAAFIANLRDIDCPEQTIRDIIIADVNALYARRRALEVLTPEQQWWRAEPDTNVILAAAAKVRDLDNERRALLASLLGPDWEAGDQISLPRPMRAGVPLDGPILGMLPQETKLAVQEITSRGQDRAEAYLEAQRRAGKSADPAELARLRQQTRQELMAVLTPPQLEEFLLRYSENARALRNELAQLRFFEASPEEFRMIFRATDELDQQLQLIAGASDAASNQRRLALLTQRAEALRLALGGERYQQFRLLAHPDYREAYAAAQQAGVPEAATAFYEIRQITEAEQARIASLTNLTVEQRAIEAKRAELEQLKAVAQALGQELPTEPPLPPKPHPHKQHVLQSGEDLVFLQRLYGVDLAALRAANPNLNLDRIKPGETINVPLTLILPPPYAPPQ